MTCVPRLWLTARYRRHVVVLVLAAALDDRCFFYRGAGGLACFHLLLIPYPLLLLPLFEPTATIFCHHICAELASCFPPVGRRTGPTVPPSSVSGCFTCGGYRISPGGTVYRHPRLGSTTFGLNRWNLHINLLPFLGQTICNMEGVLSFLPEDLSHS